MKKIMLSLMLLSHILLGYSQINRFWNNDQQAEYVPRTMQEIMYAPKIMYQRYNQNAAKVDNLINWIFELKKQTSDSQFLSAMDVYYKLLKTFYEKDLARYDNQIRNVEFSISEEVDKYNARIKASEASQNYRNDNANTNYQTSGDSSNPDLQYLFKTTFNNPPFNPSLRDEPNAASREIYSCPLTTTVYVINNNVSDTYFLVYVNGYTGYLAKSFLKRKL